MNFPIDSCFINQFDYRLEEVFVEAYFIAIEIVYAIRLRLCIIAQISYYLTDMRAVLLFHETIVIFLVGTRTGEGKAFFLGICVDMIVEKIRSVIRMEFSPGYWHAGTGVLQSN